MPPRQRTAPEAHDQHGEAVRKRAKKLMLERVIAILVLTPRPPASPPRGGATAGPRRFAHDPQTTALLEVVCYFTTWRKCALGSAAIICAGDRGAVIKRRIAKLHREMSSGARGRGD